MPSTNPFDSSSSNSSFASLEVAASSSSEGQFQDCRDGEEETVNLSVTAGVFDDQVHSLLLDTTAGNFVSPLEAALSHGVSLPGGYSDNDEEGESDEDSRSLIQDDGSATPSNSSTTWWSRVVGTLSPATKPNSDGQDIQQIDSDDASFQSARSDHSAKDDHADFASSIGKEPQAGRQQSNNVAVHFQQEAEGEQQTSIMFSRTPIRKPSQHPLSRQSSKRKRRRPMPPQGSTQVSIVLEEIGTNAAGSEFTLDYHSPGTPWTKVILLEELGTASSWLVLLLPYVTFLIALALDSTTILQDVTLAPLGGKDLCLQEDEAQIFPLAPIPPKSCSYPFKIEDGEGLISHVNARNEIVDRRYQYFMSTGWSLTSGPINDVPAMSTFLYGDMTFSNLSNAAVALVTKGSVLTSTAVFQRKYAEGNPYDSTGNNEQEWFPVSISKPQRLDLVCKYGMTKRAKWSCTSPQIVDVLFSLPATAVLTGGEIRVDSLFSYYAQQPYEGWGRRLNATDTKIIEEYGGYENYRLLKASRNETTVGDLLSGTDLSNPHQLLAEIAGSSAYILRHQRPAYAELIVIVRLISLALSFCFSVYWVLKMGFVGFCCEKRSDVDDDDSSNSQSTCSLLSFCKQRQYTEKKLVKKKGRGLNWWESPWIVFPERRYLLVVLFCLLMIQNPLLAVAYYRPYLYSSARMHVAADCLIGIGVHGILMLTTCLMQGLRYHTAAFNRKRAKQQRKALELARTARHLAAEGHPYYGTDAPASSYTSSYYERYGDTEGAGFAGALHSRLRHDPCGAQWADFLLPKLALLSIGIIFVILGAISRFPGQLAAGHHHRDQFINANSATINRDALAIYKTVYVISSFGQFSVLVLWGALIMSNIFITGHRLKKEPFLSTRPSQLAFRVLTSILFLGFLAILLPFLVEMLVALGKWMGVDNHAAKEYQGGEGGGSEIIHHTSSGFYLMDAQPSPLEVLVGIVVHATSRFPYSGTAASIGPGKILYVTVCSLVAAFIFLPATPSNDSIESETSPEHKAASAIDRDRQRSDKREVVTLAKYTHSWRVFPLPILRKKVLHHQPVPSKILPPDAFELDAEGRQRKASFHRSIIYKGRYMPVFCLETACWLLEAAWQAYYSHDEFRTDDWAPGRASLEGVGLKLDAAVHDDRSDTKAFICSNAKPQVDGEENSVIVVAFRGTATTKNMRTDLNWQQVPLPEDIQGGNDRASYQIRVGGTDGSDSYTGDVEPPPSVSLLKPRRLHGKYLRPSNIIKATPIVWQTLPCVHEGFLEAYMHIREEVLDQVLLVFQRQLDMAWRSAQIKERSRTSSSLNIPKIYVTGHSLGGSLAQLLALDLACNCEILVERMDRRHSKEAGIGSKTLQATAETYTGRERSLTQTDETFRSTYSSADAGIPGHNADGKNTPPTIKRRNSFPSKRSLFDPHTKETTGLSGDFLHSLFSGEAFNRRKGKTSLQPPIAVYTFGQPRVGNRAFARLYKQRVPHTFRVVNEGDAFTSLPIATFCGGLYKHAGLDVVLDEGCTGNILVGPTVVETMFRFGKVRTNVSAHQMENYRDNLESALSVDELQEYYRGHGGKGGSGLGRGNSHGSHAKLPEWLTSVKRSIKQ